MSFYFISHMLTLLFSFVLELVVSARSVFDLAIGSDFLGYSVEGALIEHTFLNALVMPDVQAFSVVFTLLPGPAEGRLRLHKSDSFAFRHSIDPVGDDRLLDFQSLADEDAMALWRLRV